MSNVAFASFCLLHKQLMWCNLTLPILQRACICVMCFAHGCNPSSAVVASHSMFVHDAVLSQADNDAGACDSRAQLDSTEADNMHLCRAMHQETQG